MRIRAGAVAGVLFVIALPALAEEIVYFTNGTSMPVRSHTMKDGMIQVDLGDNAYIAFPASMVDKVEQAGSGVLLRPSLGGGKNQMVQGVDAAGSFPQTGGVARARNSHEPGDDAHPERSAVEDDHGLATVRPFAGSDAANKSRLRITGSQAIFNAAPIRDERQGFVGTQRVGNHFVIPRTPPGQKGRPGGGVVTGLEMRGSRPTPPTPPQPNPSGGN
ncbi:MAG TPA: hypothetical protein VJS92_10390 [Candidatus Polarisedimenticolaceae bacterium]|nr:hypothetical protein [Candidatus Polarisedimenticolaceae bacterium]